MSRAQTLGEEIANVVTHGIGVVLSICALVLMLVYSMGEADPWRVGGVTVFGIALILMYLASTLYHAIPHPPLKKLLRVMDHCAIYLLIAGTYTPFLLVFMRGSWGWTLFFMLWGMAILGCGFKLFFTGRWNFVSTLCYIGMGWMALLTIKPAMENIPGMALFLMLLGGLSYTGGVLFYLWHRLPYHHAIWHLFVMGGSAIHFLAVIFYVVPASNPVS